MGVLAVIGIVGIVALLGRTSGRAAAEHQADRDVGALLAGVPQERQALGARDAPVTLEIFADLEDPDCRAWFLKYLPAILKDYVRPGTLKLEYRVFKTNTFFPATFVKQQTAALAAGVQDRLWNYVYTFYYEQGKELTPYVTEAYLDRIAHQVPGLNLARWHLDRQAGRREEQTTAEDREARLLGLHVTPSFRIGRTGGTMTSLSSDEIMKYGEQHPIALPRAADVGRVLTRLVHERLGS